MASDKQIAANRRNAQFSTGPRTPEGKARVALNRLSHGLAGETVVLPGEDPSDFDDLRAALTAEYLPATPSEQFLVHQLAANQWKLTRAVAIDAELFAHLMRDGVPASEAFARSEHWMAQLGPTATFRSTGFLAADVPGTNR